MHQPKRADFAGEIGFIIQNRNGSDQSTFSTVPTAGEIRPIATGRGQERANMILYHYTTPAGLKGILDEKAFWASDCRFLNDTSEFHFGKEMVRRAIESYKEDIQAAGPSPWSLLSALMNHADKMVALVASFTSKGDLLSQWRGYNHGRGFAIGINDSWLIQNADKQGFALFPVVYDPETQTKSVDGAMKRLLTALEEVNNDPNRVDDVVRDWWKYALRVALAMKNELFSEEQEHRLAYIGQSWPSRIKTRTGSAGIIPYLPCRIDEVILRDPMLPHQNLGFEEIIVGPALKGRQLAAVDALLASHHMRFKVVKSEIPYTAD